MPKRHKTLYTPSPDDMYVEDKVDQQPSEREDYHQEIKYYEDRIYSLEQEVIKLQLKNNLTVAKQVHG